MIRYVIEVSVTAFTGKQRGAWENFYTLSGGVFKSRGISATGFYYPAFLLIVKYKFSE